MNRERTRLFAALRILNTEPEERFDRITRLAKRLFGTRHAFVNLIGEHYQHAKSQTSDGNTAIPREYSFCNHTVALEHTLVVPDLRADGRFQDNPYVLGEPHMRFYAGRPLWIDGHHKPVGTLCVIDDQPKHLHKADLEVLDDLGVMVEREIQALQWATLDELTGLSNRLGFTTLAEYSMALCRRQHLAACLIYIDLRQFKQINDTLGHHTGDQALIEFANLLQQSFRDSDVLGRIGGDEFVIFCSDIDHAGINAVMHRLQSNVTAWNRTSGMPYKLHFNIGFEYMRPDADTSLQDMLAQADKQMYQHKLQGRARSQSARDHSPE